MNEKVSILMGIFNCADTLPDAVKSILGQTYSDWELILCDDGSSDDTYLVAEEYAAQDSRIILLKNDHNMGLNHTLNRCLQAATGKYIARMDGDDTCSPDRFEKQVKALKNYPDFSIVSTEMSFFDENGIWGSKKVPEYPSKTEILTGNPICHAPVMMMKECMDSVHGYTEDPKMLRVEDVNLWIKLYAKGYRCRNIQEALYQMRNDQNAMNRRKYRYRVNSTYVRLKGCRELKAGIKCYFLAFKPMVFGLVPSGLRSAIRKKQQRY